MTQAEFQNIAATIPAQPGIYRYYDAANQLLYVGKAKHLRKRVSSYFNKTVSSYKTHELVRRIHKIECTIVNDVGRLYVRGNAKLFLRITAQLHFHTNGRRYLVVGVLNPVRLRPAEIAVPGYGIQRVDAAIAGIKCYGSDFRHVVEHLDVVAVHIELQAGL